MSSFSRGSCVFVKHDTKVFPLDEICPRMIRKGTLLLVATFDGDSITFVGINENGQAFRGQDYCDPYDVVLHPGYSVGHSVGVKSG